MNYCTNCGGKLESNENFCGKCGSLNYGEKADFVNSSLKTLKALFINPVSFLRTSRSVNMQFTGVLLSLIAIMELLSTGGIEDFIGIPSIGIKLFFTVFFITVLFLIIKASTLFGFQKIIIKKDTGFLPLLNVSIYSHFIYHIIAFISMFIGVHILPIWLVSLLIMFAMIFSSLLMYQSYKTFLNTDAKSCIITFCLSHLTTLIIIISMINVVIKSML